MPSAASQLRELLRRIRAGPLSDPELMQLTLEALLLRWQLDMKRARRQRKDPDTEDY